MAVVYDWAVRPVYDLADEYFFTSHPRVPTDRFPLVGPVALWFLNTVRHGHASGVVAYTELYGYVRVTFASHRHELGVAIRVPRSCLDISPWIHYSIPSTWTDPTHSLLLYGYTPSWFRTLLFSWQASWLIFL